MGRKDVRGEERIMPGEENYAWGGKLCLGRKDMLGEEMRCRVCIILIIQY